MSFQFVAKPQILGGSFTFPIMSHLSFLSSTKNIKRAKAKQQVQDKKKNESFKAGCICGFNNLSETICSSSENILIIIQQSSEKIVSLKSKEEIPANSSSPIQSKIGETNRQRSLVKISVSTSKKPTDKLPISSRRFSYSRGSTEDVGKVILLDAKRTFQKHPFFANESTQNNLSVLLERIAKLDGVEYVQGINFWVAAISFHFGFGKEALRVSEFLWKSLGLKRLYRQGIDRHVAFMAKLLQTYLPNMSEFLKINSIDLKLLIIDWFFSLGFMKIPLEYSINLLFLLVKHGWYFFHRLLFSYFQAFQNFHIEILGLTNETGKFERACLLKNFFKNETLEWTKIINKATTLMLNDKSLAASLDWKEAYVFSPPDLPK